MSNKYNIEELFKNKFEGYEEQPSRRAWVKTKRVLNRKQFMRFNPRRFNIYYTVGAILIGTALTFTAFFNEEKQQNNPEITENTTQNQINSPEANNQSLTQQQISNQHLKQNESESESESKIEGEFRSAEAQQSLKQLSINKNAFSQNAAKEESAAGNEASEAQQNLNQSIVKQNKAREETGDSQKNNIDPAFKNQVNESSPLGVTGSINTMVVYFMPSVTEGCAPLTVEFKNLSTNTENFVWDLGSNQSDTSKKQPVTVYKESGNYTVTLFATDQNGLTLSHSEIITVHPKPEALFEIKNDYIYNYSTDANQFTWSLIANDTLKISTDYEFSQSNITNYLQTAASNQQLSLIASNIYGCSDTITKKLPDLNTPSLSFPTAFSPNPDGPTGGYYSQNDINNNVFHPSFSEDPLKYNLRIFSRTGELIFESNDIFKGWDGYYKESIVEKGVYVYHVIGIWKNGKTFNYRGDISVL